MRPNSRCGLTFVMTALSIDHMHAVSASYLHVQSDTDSENYTCMLREKGVMFAGLSWCAAHSASSFAGMRSYPTCLA